MNREDLKVNNVYIGFDGRKRKVIFVGKDYVVHTSIWDRQEQEGICHIRNALKWEPVREVKTISRTAVLYKDGQVGFWIDRPDMICDPLKNTISATKQIEVEFTIGVFDDRTSKT